MNIAPRGRKPSSGESPVCTLLHSSAGSVTSSISLNLGCRGNGSLRDTMWSITNISAKRRKEGQKSRGRPPPPTSLRNKATADREVRQKYALPENYFLASARFVEKKNLAMLIQAYAEYRRSSAFAKATADKEVRDRKLGHQSSAFTLGSCAVR